jgi:hypothetical protein
MFVELNQQATALATGLIKKPAAVEAAATFIYLILTASL